ncbi:anhydro-N-acetylmuramic acid kinase [Chitinibacter sp. ZOR0017]|uniref:anhydro-N-acetylmuramic acid kinase n=1 Tax=Chitinibacter sp. ZOR0017 TaxID=1339254 RepID=UPI000646A74D|nr:anhydro-N-acetylmuramic acid kinase [Chitinibacter sp. ZOR0017]
MTATAYYIGLMTGTSLDGIDAVLVDFASASPQLIATASAPLPTELRAELLTLQSPGANELQRAALAANGHSRASAALVQQLLAQAQLSPLQIKAIGNHGQTIRHRPELGYTLQIGNHALLAEDTGITVIGDFRSRDVAAGGQGAPLVPAFHHALFAAPGRNRVVLNIGGMANLSWLGADGWVTGFDSGPGNVLLDSWIAQQRGASYDADGAWAATGTVNAALLAALLAEPYFALPAPKSTGRDLFDAAWLHDKLSAFSALAAVDVQATLAELSAQTMAAAILELGQPDEVLVCGGGAYNTDLLQRLARQLGCPISTTAELGVAPTWVEAYAFAWLALRCQQGQSGNLPAVTGARGERILGAIYPA